MIAPHFAAYTNLLEWVEASEVSDTTIPEAYDYVVKGVDYAVHLVAPTARHINLAEFIGPIVDRAKSLFQVANMKSKTRRIAYYGTGFSLVSLSKITVGATDMVYDTYTRVLVESSRHLRILTYLWDVTVRK
jgi:hypothetical protein